jgi:hypothetical protein
MGGSRFLLAILVFTSLMIIDDLDAFRRAFAPDEADSPLIVDPDTMLTLLSPPKASGGIIRLSKSFGNPRDSNRDWPNVVVDHAGGPRSEFNLVLPVF